MIKTDSNLRLKEILNRSFGQKIQDLAVIKYNIITPKQLSHLTGKAIGSIYADLTSGKITEAYPFPTGSKDFGPRFILIDESLFKYIDNIKR